MYSWVRYGVAIYLGLALAGAMGGPPARGGSSEAWWPMPVSDETSDGSATDQPDRPDASSSGEAATSADGVLFDGHRR